MATEFKIINPFEAQDWWNQCQPLIDEVIDSAGVRCRYDAHHVWAWILQGRMMLWLVKDGEQVQGLMITESLGYPKGNALLVFMAAVHDDFKHRLDLSSYLGIVEEWAKATGHSMIQVSGRLGWKKMLFQRLYSDPLLVTQKVLTNERFH